MGVFWMQDWFFKNKTYGPCFIFKNTFALSKMDNSKAGVLRAFVLFLNFDTPIVVFLTQLQLIRIFHKVRQTQGLYPIFAQNPICNAQHGMKKLHYTPTGHWTRFYTSTWHQPSLVPSGYGLVACRFMITALFNVHLLETLAMPFSPPS
jgi:hypothetical protein